ncbi:ion transporter [Gilvimarinus sp. DA14]|uniref:ion transporter n=1 Tax=Gilvimarinus sp. DA14 TaxID=2956798 RepID=UPI0020B87451|nr:ion transporter [Gilvimarinus sp. DA14]UTF60733.1 ion transporter [Gilvimarinus sp. DA14]
MVKRSRSMTPRRKVYISLEPRAWPFGISPVNLAICGLILLSMVGAIVETEPSISRGHERLIRALEVFFSGLFFCEYLARLWVCVEDRRYRQPFLGRAKYAFTPAALLDLIACLPLLLGVSSSESLLLRFVRLFRVLRLARYGQLARAVQHVFKAIMLRRYELTVSIIIAVGMILASSTLLYFAEREVQPEAFGSIPRAMWWAIITFTTVGYGDVYPITQWGRVFAALTALSSIGLIAMPTGILASAFSDAMRRGRDEIVTHTKHNKIIK